jgi:hypothetical protein
VKPPRKIQSLLDELGLELLSCRCNRHYVLHLRNEHGVSQIVSMCKTPSDTRSDMNARAELRRLAKLTIVDLSGITPRSSRKDDT